MITAITALAITLITQPADEFDFFLTLFLSVGVLAFV